MKAQRHAKIIEIIQNNIVETQEELTSMLKSSGFDTTQATVYSGKDYLRLEKNPSMAAETFKALLQSSVTGENIIYLITEKEHIALLPDEAFRIVLTAELEVIKERFRGRMRGNLPLSVEKMLEAKHGMYDDLPCQLKLDGDYDAAAVLSALGLA